MIKGSRGCLFEPTPAGILNSGQKTQLKHNLKGSGTVRISQQSSFISDIFNIYMIYVVRKNKFIFLHVWLTEQLHSVYAQ